MSKHKFQSSIVFCGWTGEELGVLGSAAYAAELNGKSANVVAAIAMDMIGYLAPGDAMDVDVLSNSGSASLRTAFADAVALYEPSAAQVDGQIPQGASSDHASFWQEGYPALLLFEDTDQYTPYLHTAQDTIGTSFNSPTLAEETARGAAAVLATLAVPDDGASPTPTPTPNPTGTPGGNGANGGIVHGSCMCEVASDAGAANAILPALIFTTLALAATRRRGNG